MKSAAKIVIATVILVAAQEDSPKKEDSCSKYAVWGEEALAGCHGCQKYFPGDVDKCMGCGRACVTKVCAGKSQQDCVRDPHFVSCDKECLSRVEPDHNFSPNATCEKFSTWGEDAVKGCKACGEQFPTPAGFRHCLGCGKKCWHLHCNGKGKEIPMSECVKSPEFGACDIECIKESPVVHSACDKYASWGADAAEGCKNCEKYFPTTKGVDKCMDCGKKCWDETCQGKTKEECVKSEQFMACDKMCIKGFEDKVMKEPHKSDDCYFDSECHKLVDWEKINKIKTGFLMRMNMMKRLKANRGNDNTRRMIEKVHSMFKKAGMPEDRIDYIVKTWVLSVYPESMAVSGEDKKEGKSEEEVLI